MSRKNYQIQTVIRLLIDKIINSAIHGKNGVGRLTFFLFSNLATWETVYEKENKRFKYQIQIDMDKLNTYDKTGVVETRDPVGTIVSFTNIKEITSYNLETDIKTYLMREFGWFLELNKPKGFILSINDSALDYSNLIAGKPEIFPIVFAPSDTKFEVHYIQWNEVVPKIQTGC